MAKKQDGSGHEEHPRDEFETGYDILLVNGPITEPLYGEILGCVSTNRQNSRVVLTLVTYGGVANPAYRIGRYLQSVYDDFVVFVPSLCKSAGTLLVTAGNRLLISPFGEIGPLDVQLPRRDEIFGRRSGLTTRAAMTDLSTRTFEVFEEFMLGIIERSSGNVSFKLAAELSARVASQVMSEIYNQMNPETIGRDYRDLRVATEYGERLNRRYQNLKPDMIQRLVHEYPSHDFVIDLEEAKGLFERVSLPSARLFQIMAERANDMMRPRTEGSLVEMLTAPSEGAVMQEKADDKQPQAAQERRNVNDREERRVRNGPSSAS